MWNKTKFKFIASIQTAFWSHHMPLVPFVFSKPLRVQHCMKSWLPGGRTVTWLQPDCECAGPADSRHETEALSNLQFQSNQTHIQRSVRIKTLDGSWWFETSGVHSTHMYCLLFNITQELLLLNAAGRVHGWMDGGRFTKHSG